MKQKSLLDLIDKRILQHLLTGFCEKFNSGMKIICFNSDNEPILIQEDESQKRLWSSICAHYRNNMEGDEACNAFDLEKAKELISSGSKEATYYYCEPLGMIDIIAPIIVQNKTIGAIITGQRIIDEQKTFKKICEKFPEHQCAFKEAFNEEKNKKQSKIAAQSPALEEIKKLRNELQSFANLIGEIGDKVETLEIEKHQRETFLERVAHSLSLPLESAFIDTYNLKEEVNSEDSKHLFNEIQSLVLVVKNILHGGETQTLQKGKTDFEDKYPILQLKEACEMFKAEAEDKKCDIKITIELTNTGKIPLEIDDLKNINSIYAKIISHQFPDFPYKFTDPNKIFKITSTSKPPIRYTISELIKYFCTLTKLDELYYNQSYYKPFTVLDPDNNNINFNFFNLRKCYLSTTKMNPTIIDLAYENLIHNAIKYSYSSVNNPNHPHRYVSINCIFKDEISIEFENYGVGITPDEIKSGLIWESRYRGELSQDCNRTGAGLGLTHAKFAVETIHNGKISCISNPVNTADGNAYLTKFIITFNNKLK
jgi:signal transduction histidine kinase